MKSTSMLETKNKNFILTCFAIGLIVISASVGAGITAFAMNKSNANSKLESSITVMQVVELLTPEVFE